MALNCIKILLKKEIICSFSQANLTFHLGRYKQGYSMSAEICPPPPGATKRLIAPRGGAPKVLSSSCRKLIFVNTKLYNHSFQACSGMNLSMLFCAHYIMAWALLQFWDRNKKRRGIHPPILAITSQRSVYCAAFRCVTASSADFFAKSPCFILP
jgi:hypothetical protein